MSNNDRSEGNTAGAVIFPLTFAFLAFFLPLFGKVGLVFAFILIAFAAFFIAWCRAPLWCKIIMRVCLALGFLFSLYVKVADVKTFAPEILTAIGLFVIGHILGRYNKLD